MNPPKDAEFQKFTNAMRDILKVSKTELEERIAKDNQERKADRVQRGNKKRGPNPKSKA
jgi:hypothetical protein